MKQNIETTCQDKNDAEFEKQVDEVCEQWKSFFREPYTGIDMNGIAMPEVMRTAHTEGYDAFRRNMAVFYKLYGFRIQATHLKLPFYRYVNNFYQIIQNDFSA